MMALSALTLLGKGEGETLGMREMSSTRFFLFFPSRYQENLKVHSIRVMAVIEKMMHRLDDPKRAALVSQYSEGGKCVKRPRLERKKGVAA